MLGIIIAPNLFVHSVKGHRATAVTYQALSGLPQSDFLAQFDRPTTGVLANFLVFHPM